MYFTRFERDQRDRAEGAAPSMRGQRQPESGCKRGARSGLRAAVVDRSPVTIFLKEINLGQYAEVFHRNGFDDMEVLVEIEDDHMRELGLPPGHMLKLKKRLRELGQAAAPATAKPPTAASAPQRMLCSTSHPSGSMMTTVQMSWVQVKELGTDTAGELFYKKFFAIQPEAKDLFPVSVRMRYRDWTSEEEESETDLNNSPALRKLWAKVVDAVGSAVAGLQDIKKLAPQLQQLGMRHVGYGLKAEYWRVAEKVLVEVLQEGLQEKFTDDIRDAWVMVYGFMTAIMLSGYQSAKAEIAAKELEWETQRSYTSETATPSSSAHAGGA